MIADDSSRTRDDLIRELRQLRRQIVELVGRPAPEVCRDVTRRGGPEEKPQSEQSFAEQLFNLFEQDRRLIAYEIHDGLVQYATSAVMQLESLLDEGELLSGQARQRVQRAMELVRKAVGEARRLISGLRPPILDELGVVPAIRFLLEEQQHERPPISFRAQVQFDRLEPLLERSIYRIVQEAVTNIRRHSQTERAEIRLTQAADRIHVEIQDWGIGFDPAVVGKTRFGLQGIRERARLFAGRAVIESNPGEGTRIFVDLPVAARFSKPAPTVGVSNE